MPDYKWLPSTCADPRFPMRVVRGVLANGNTPCAFLPDNRILVNGWGVVGNIEVIGEELKSVPSTLAVLWFSYAEDKFYFVESKLDADAIEKLLRDGLDDPMSGERIRFSYILVGLSLLGHVSVWLVGTKAVIEVAHLQGAEPDVKWEDFFGKKKYSRQEFLSMGLEKREWDKAVDAYQNPNDIPKSLQADYRRRYSWKMTFAGAEVASIWLRTFDGQAMPVDPKTGMTLVDNQTVPKEIKISWQSGPGVTSMASVTMKEEEIFQVFSQLQALVPDAQLQLQLELGQSSSAVAVSVRSPKLVVPLKRVRV